MNTHLMLIILALLCFLLSFLLDAFDVRKPRGNLIAAGLFLWLLATVVGGA